MKRTFVIALVLCIATGAGLAEPQDASIRLTGNASALWLVVESPDTFDIYAKAAGSPWKSAARDLTPTGSTRPTAVGDRLHLFWSPRTHAAITLQGRQDMLANLPVPVLSACNGPYLAAPTAEAQDERSQAANQQAEGRHRSGEALYILGRASQAATDSPEEPPTAEETPAAPAEIYRFSGMEWTRLTTHELAGGPDSWRLAVGDGHLFVLVQVENEPSLHIWDSQGDTWTSHPAALDGSVVGFEWLDGMLQVLLRDQDNVLTIRSWDAGERQWNLAVDVQRDSTAATLAPPLQATRFAGKWAILHGTFENATVTMCSTGGTLLPAESLKEILEAVPDSEQVRTVANYFLIVLIAAIVLAMFVLGPKPTPRPFVLPEGIRPAGLFRRGIAAMIDLLPFSLGTMAVMMTQMTTVQIEELFVSGKTMPPPMVVYTSITLIVVYIAYGTVMELRFGATLGKMFLGLRVVGIEASPVNLRGVLLRNMLKVMELGTASSSTLWLILIVLLPILFTRNRQRLGDMVAQTCVVEVASLPKPSAGHELGPRQTPETRDDEGGEEDTPPPSQQDRD